MFRLIFQLVDMMRPEWKDHTDLEALREERRTMLSWADHSNARWALEPMIQNIEKDREAEIHERIKV